MSTLTQADATTNLSATTACVTVIFNPVSGASNAEDRKKAIADALASHGYTCQFLITAPDTQVKDIVDNAIKNGADVIAVAGGDGTIMEVLSALMGTQVPAAIVPSGTGNLLSINLGIPATVPEAIDIALHGQARRIDLARAQVRKGDGKETQWRHFAIIGGIGLDAHMIRDADREAKRRWGVFAYLRAILLNLSRHRLWASISVDDGPAIRRRFKTVIVANMSKMLGGLDAIPTASPNDGILDVGVIRPGGLGQWLTLLWLAILGRPQDSPHMDVFRGKKVVLTTSQPHPVEFDGESCGETTEVTIEILPDAVTIMMPTESQVTEHASTANEVRAVSTMRFAAIGIGAGAIVAGIIYMLRRRRR